MRSTYYSLVAKAHKYAEEKDRFHLKGLEITCHGSNADHVIRLDGGTLRCDCDHFRHERVCAHVLATELLLRPFLPKGVVYDPYVPPGPAAEDAAR